MDERSHMADCCTLRETALDQKRPFVTARNRPRAAVRQRERPVSSGYFLADITVSGFTIASGGFGCTVSCRLKAECGLPLSEEGSERIS